MPQAIDDGSAQEIGNQAGEGVVEQQCWSAFDREKEQRPSPAGHDRRAFQPTQVKQQASDDQQAQAETGR